MIISIFLQIKNYKLKDMFILSPIILKVDTQILSTKHEREDSFTLQIPVIAFYHITFLKYFSKSLQLLPAYNSNNTQIFFCAVDCDFLKFSSKKIFPLFPQTLHKHAREWPLIINRYIMNKKTKRRGTLEWLPSYGGSIVYPSIVFPTEALDHCLSWWMHFYSKPGTLSTQVIWHTE